MTNKFYVLRGHETVPVNTVEEWAREFDDKARMVAKDNIGDSHISTVFLGVDHSFGHGKPLLFESRVFGGFYDQEQRRYSTWDEAKKGHAELVEAVLKKIREQEMA